MDQEKVDIYRPTFSLAVQRTYPFSEETLTLYKIHKTVEFMNFLKNNILRKMMISGFNRKNVLKFCHISRSDPNNKKRKKKKDIDLKKIQCKIMNLSQLVELSKSVFNVKDLSTNELSILCNLYLTPQLKVFIEQREFQKSVYICLYHDSVVHVCEERFCSEVIKCKDERRCSISMKSTTLIEDSPKPWEHDCVDFSVYNRKKCQYGKQNFYEDGMFRYNGKPLNVNSKWITKRLRKLFTNVVDIAELSAFIWAQYNMFNSMVKEDIITCEKVTDTVKKKRRRRKPKKRKMPKKRKQPRRKKRKSVKGHFDKYIKEKFKKSKTISDKNFKLKKKKFLKLLKEIEENENLMIVNFTSMIKFKCYSKTVMEGDFDKSFYAPMSRQSFYVDPIPESWDIPYEKVKTRIKKHYLFYMSFLRFPEYKKVIDSDLNKELSLRNLEHPYLQKASKEFIDELPQKISIIRRLCPGLFRLIMFHTEIIKECNEKFSAVKNSLKALHKKEYVPDYGDFYKNLRYNPRKHYFHSTISDELMLQISEVMFWGEKMCLSHPNVSLCNSTELTKEIIYIGILYLLKTGLKKNGKTIIPKHPLLAKRGYLASQHELSSYLTNRKDASKGPDKVTNILINFCDMYPNSEVSFLEWKRKNSQLTY